MANTTIEFLSLTGLRTYDSQIKTFIDAKVSEGDAKSFKYVNLVDRVLKFYTINPISDDTVPAYEIELPEQDVSHLMQLVKTATKGNIASFGDGGQVVDSGIKAEDIATKDELSVVSDKAGENAADIATMKGQIDALEKGTYDDTEVRELIQGNTDAISAIAEDYLKAADKTELSNAITAESEAARAAEEANAAAIKAISDDYLKGSDKTELEGKITTAQAKGEEALSKAQEVAADLTEAVEALEAADEKLAADIKANADAIDLLNGEGVGSVKKAVDDAINKFATDVTNDDVVNSYKELIDWAAEHGAEAAEMVAAIEANELAISDLAKLVGALPEGETSVDIVAYIQKLVNAEADRASEAEGGLAGRIEELEGKFIGENSVDAKIAAAVNAEKAEREAADELKADKTALEATNTEVAKKADITALNDEIAAREAADAQVLVDAKADTDAKIAAEVTARDNAIAAAKAEAIADAEGKNTELKTALETALKKYADDEDAIIESRVDALEDASSTYALASDLTTLAGRVTAEEGKVTTLQAEMDAVEAKAEANATTIANHATAIAGKASQSDLNAMDGKVTNLEKDVEALKDVEYVAITTEQINELFA